MKKFWLSLGLALLLACLGGIGYHGQGTSGAYAQQPPAVPGYTFENTPYGQAEQQYNPNNGYYNYYSVPYEDPRSTFFYYAVPEFGGEMEEHLRRHERRERREYGR